MSTGAATRVGLIDTGVDFTHPALGPWLDPGVDLINGRSASEFDGLSLQGAETLYLLDAETLYLLDNGFARAGGVPPALGHGTMVAGVVHAVAPDAVIVPLKTFDAYGNATLFNIVDAVYRAGELRIDVLNMSFSGNLDSTVLRTAINLVRSQGMSVVSSIGNQGKDAGDVFPASYAGVYGVAATDFNDRLAAFSNFGRSVSIAAPGAFLISTAPGGQYAAVWGTSFSAPLVSGTIALLSSLTTRGYFVGPRVLITADSIDAVNPGFENQLGRGRLNALRALQGR
jgi:subtilisin family serine protease